MARDGMRTHNFLDMLPQLLLQMRGQNIQSKRDDKSLELEEKRIANDKVSDELRNALERLQIMSLEKSIREDMIAEGANKDISTTAPLLFGSEAREYGAGGIGNRVINASEIPKRLKKIEDHLKNLAGNDSDDAKNARGVLGRQLVNLQGATEDASPPGWFKQILMGTVGQAMYGPSAPAMKFIPSGYGAISKDQSKEHYRRIKELTELIRNQQGIEGFMEQEQ